MVCLSNGDAESFIMKVENEGNIDYDEQTEKLTKGHLTILKAVKRVIADEEEEEEKSEEDIKYLN